MAAPAWVDVVLGGLGTAVVNVGATMLRDRRKARREETARLARKASEDSERQDHELRELSERVARLEGPTGSS